MIISIETSTSYLSLTLLNKESILSHISIPIKNELSEIIVPKIIMFLKDNRISFDDISFLAVGCGPGSFTGIRLAASWVQSFAYGSNIPVYGVSSLKNIAYKAYKQTNKNQA